MTAKKRPSLIVMKRLDTMGLRLLSQAVGAGTRRAGVRLSPRGELTPHQRGEPISSAPPPAEGEASDDASLVAAPPREISVETPAFIDATGTLSAEIRELASAQLALRIAEGRAHAEDAEPEAADATAMIATGASAAPAPADDGAALAASETRARRSTMAWGAALVTAGALAGVLIARVVGGAPPVSDARAQMHVGAPSDTTAAGIPARDDGPRPPSATEEGASAAAPSTTDEGTTTETPPAASPPAEPARDSRPESRGGEAHATPPGPQLEPARAGE